MNNGIRLGNGRSVSRITGWLGVLAVCFLASAARADQARTACILLNGGTIRILPVGQTTCSPLEGAIQIQQSSRAMEKTLTANINADGTIAQQDQYTDSTGAQVNWIQSVLILNGGISDPKTGVARVTFRPGTFAVNAGLKCSITPTTEIVPRARIFSCAFEEDGGCPTPDHWVAVLTNKSVNGIDADTRNAAYKAAACDRIVTQLGDFGIPRSSYKCTESSTKRSDTILYRPGNNLVNLETALGTSERSAFSLTCTGY